MAFQLMSVMTPSLVDGGEEDGRSPRGERVRQERAAGRRVDAMCDRCAKPIELSFRRGVVAAGEASEALEEVALDQGLRSYLKVAALFGGNDIGEKIRCVRHGRLHRG
jgi:hypothetical protein